MSGTLNEHSQKHDSVVPYCQVCQGPSRQKSRPQSERHAGAIHETSIAGQRNQHEVTELRERPPAAYASPSGGAVSGAGAGSWEKSDSLVQVRIHRGSPAHVADSVRPPPPPSGPPPSSPSAPVFGRDPSRTRTATRAAGAAPDNRARCAHEEPGHPQHREPCYPCRSCGKSVCEDCFDHDCNSCFKCSDQFPRCRTCRGRGGRHVLYARRTTASSASHRPTKCAGLGRLFDQFVSDA